MDRIDKVDRDLLIKHEIVLENIDKTMTKLVKHMESHDEKLTALLNLKESVARSHNRIDELEKAIKEVNKNGCSSHSKNVTSLMNNRKWLITLVMGAVFMALLGLVVGNLKGSLESENKALKSQIRHIKKGLR